MSPSTIVLGATLRDVLLITDVEVPPPLSHLVLEKSVLIDDEEAREEEENGSRALKRGRR